jgi:hypothetical protein
MAVHILWSYGKFVENHSTSSKCDLKGERVHVSENSRLLDFADHSSVNDPAPLGMAGPHW